jgi:hypothetical protein
MNPLEDMKKDVLQRILAAKRNAQISDIKLISLLNERISNGEDFLHRNTVNDWKNSKSASFMEYLDDIAEFTRTSADFLIGRKKSESPLDTQSPQVYDEHDTQLLSLFHELNREGREKVAEYAALLARSGEYKKDREASMEA